VSGSEVARTWMMMMMMIKRVVPQVLFKTLTKIIANNMGLSVVAPEEEVEDKEVELQQLIHLLHLLQWGVQDVDAAPRRDADLDATDVKNEATLK
jgi:hypothetical protein